MPCGRESKLSLKRLWPPEAIMELYTLVSLALGIFGGTYAALSALRTHFESSIKSAHGSCDNQLSKLIATNAKGGKIAKHCRRQRNSICRAKFIWDWSHTLPAVLFALFIFAVFGGVLYHWDQIDAQHSATGTATLTALKGLFPWKHVHLALWVLG